MTQTDTSAFASALHRAILDRGLTLERIAHRLRERGFRLSTATLSYWASGRSQPERQESLAALGVLEEILGAGQGELRRLLVKRPRKSRRRQDRPLPWDELWTDVAALVARVAGPGYQPDLLRRTLSLHERFTLGPDGAERSCRVITTMEAIEPDLDRILIVFRNDAGGEQQPHVRAVSGARLGRVDRDEQHNLVVAELLFDQPLRSGERTVVEHEILFPPGGNRSQVCERRFSSAIPQYVLEVVFHPAAVPDRLRAFGALPDGERTNSVPISTGQAGTARLVLTEPPIGIHGVEWDWA